MRMVVGGRWIAGTAGVAAVCLLGLTPPRSEAAEAAAQYVIIISVDGMGSEYVKPLLPTGITNELTTFKRFQAEGVGTLNGRDDANYAVTLPNHVTIATGRGVAGAAGHGWTSNTDPAPTDTIASNKGAYVASGFDVAHDHGLRTGIWSGKSKFNLFQQSYGPATGAPDVTGADNGRDKIDYDKVVAGMPAATLTADFTNQMAAQPFHFAFLHYQDPDATGHSSGWSTNPASAFAATLKRVDTEVGRILQMVTSRPDLKGRTAIILTADHGGHGTTHGDTGNLLDFTVPFYVWGAGAASGGDLYAMNPGRRTSPAAASNPPYTGPQPIRNGESANTALGLLGLGPVPGSTIDSNQDLVISVTGRVSSVSADGGVTVLRWPGASGWLYTVLCTASLEPLVSWTNLPGQGDVQGIEGPMSVTDSNDVAGRRFYRLRMAPSPPP